MGSSWCTQELGCASTGCELSVNSQSCVVKEDDDFLEHLVLLKTVRCGACWCDRAALLWGLCSVMGALPNPQISLGADARDELHVVAVESKNTYGDHKPVPIASLRVSVLPMVSKGE